MLGFLVLSTFATLVYVVVTSQEVWRGWKEIRHRAANHHLKEWRRIRKYKAKKRQ